MSQILCQIPTIIRHPYMQSLVSTYGNFKLGKDNSREFISDELRALYNYSFPSRNFSPKKLGVTLENIDEFNVVNPSTGELLNLYMAVPCGKCPCCVEKKRREWSFRGIAETVYSETTPIFVTLTYNNNNLPKNGLQKTDVQKFMKRLRINLERDGHEVKLRYMLCGEYGSKTHRPHYHAVIWNYPQMKNLHNRLASVEKAWQLGFCYVVTCDAGAVRYICKYLRKESSFELPQGWQRPFLLSSRRNGGIGAEFAKSQIAPLRKNPNSVKLFLRNPSTGKVEESFITPFFKRYIFPSISQFIPKSVTDSYKKLKLLLSEYNSCTFNNLPFKPTLSSDTISVLRKWKFLSNFNKSIGKYKLPLRLLRKRGERILSEIQSCTNILKIFSLPEYCKDYFRCREIYGNALNLAISSLPPVDVNEHIFLLNKRNSLAQLREIF